MGYEHATIALCMDIVLFEEATAEVGEGGWGGGKMMGSSVMLPPQVKLDAL